MWSIPILPILWSEQVNSWTAFPTSYVLIVIKINQPSYVIVIMGKTTGVTSRTGTTA